MIFHRLTSVLIATTCLMQIIVVNGKSIAKSQKEWIKDLDDEEAIVEIKVPHNVLKDSVIDQKENWIEEVIDRDNFDDSNDEDTEEEIDGKEEEAIIDKIIDINEKVDELLSEGDIKESDGQSNANEKRSVVKDLRKIWRSRTIPYRLDETITDRVSFWTGMSNKAAILQAISEFESNTCLKFKVRSDEEIYINFMKGFGCWSFVGMQDERQNISIGEGCESVGIVEHEIMHAIGFYHEQSRYDRDNYVEILWENILFGKDHNFEKRPSNETVNLDSAYDYDGLMHYSIHSFSSNGLPTIMPIGNISQQLGQRNGFSTQDLIQINKLYQCEDAEENIWSSWGPYSACTSNGLSCEKERQKFCFKDSTTCNHTEGVITEAEDCDAVECEVNGNWGRWAPWSTCTKTCEAGIHSRSRACDSPPKSSGGSDCIGDSHETGLCQMWPCTIDANSLACDFENNTICSFITSVKDRTTNTMSFDLRQGKTATVLTGPAVDHTIGTDTGHYIYIKSSGASPGDKATLSTPEFSQGTRCLSFFYFMNGQTIGKLSASINETGEETELFSVEGQQYPEWLLGRITVTSNVQHNIVLNAFCGNGFYGDIALDDIAVTEGSCDDGGMVSTPQPTIESTSAEATTTEAKTTVATTTEVTTTEATTAEMTTTEITTTEETTAAPTTPALPTLSELQAIVDCDFTGSTCSWTQKPTNEVLFHYDQAGYIAIDLSSSEGVTPPQPAIISSTTFQGNGEAYCFEFRYRMRGSGGSYLIAELSDGIGEPSILFLRSGNQGKRWKTGYFDLSLPSGNDCEISFAAEVYGTKSNHGIRLDDFALNAGPCSFAESPTILQAEFSSDLSHWKQSQTDSFDWDIATTSLSSKRKTLYLNPPSRINGDKAVLQSPLVFNQDEACMKFLYKNGGGVLKVESVTTEFGVERNEVLFEQAADPTRSKFEWGFVQLPVGISYRLLLVGLPSSNSDMAVRRIRTFAGKCPMTIFKRDFETDDSDLAGYSKGQCSPRRKRLGMGHVYSFDLTNCKGVETNKISMNFEPSISLPTSGACLIFLYQMKGQCPMKVLQVETDQSVRTVFEHSAMNPFSKWRRVRTPLTNINGILPANVKLVFMTTIDNSKSDARDPCEYVYLDMISVESIQCPAQAAIV